jgi:branched-chain amino acid transport system substrate-binding protein
VAFERLGNKCSRREFLKVAGITGAAVGLSGGLGGLLAACGDGEDGTNEPATTNTSSEGTTSVSSGAEGGRALKIGVVSPQTGGLAAFAVSVNWAVDRLSTYLKDGIVGGDGKKHALEFIKKDTQSDTNRAAAVTGDLIQTDAVDIVLSAGAPDTVNPSADVCEAMGCPSLSAGSVWQAFYYDRKPPETGFTWTYGILLGSETTIINFVDMFDQIPNNKKVGMLFANDANAAGWMKPEAAPAVFKAKGYTLVEPSWYTPGAEDFTAQISQFKKAGCEIICGSNNPAEFTNFWRQSHQQGFKPKLVSTGIALMFPETLMAIGDTGNGLIGELGWHRTYPYKCTITGATAEELAVDYETKMNQMVSTNTTVMYELIEWAVDAFKRAKNPEDKMSVVDAIKTTKLVATCGPIDFTVPVDTANAADPMTSHPVPNVVKGVCCSGQWVKGTKYPFEQVICSNVTAPDVKVMAKVKPLTYS